MADDIVKALSQSYSEVSDNEKWHTGWDNAETLDKTFGKNIDVLSSQISSLLDNEGKKIEEIKQKEAKRFETLFKNELKAEKFSQKIKSDLLKQENEHYDSLYNLKLKLHEKEVSFLEDERKIRQQIAQSGKVTLGDLAQLYTKQREINELEKQSLEYKEQQFKKGVDNVKQAFRTITDHILKYFNEKDNLLGWNQWETGIKGIGSNYEENFTEIAARNGSSTQMETHTLIGDALDKVVNDSVLSKGLNFNNEVFPEITNAVQKGFKGEEATDVAISNAIDKKITPWLDTSSETWVNLQYQLSDDMLAQLKGQQLLLQETREGNRILQNGVVGALLDELAPTLLNIDANTTDVTSLSGQAQAIVASLMDNGYSQQDAIKVANQTIDAYQNPYANLKEGSTPWQKMLALGGLQGGDLASAMNFATNAISPFNNGSWVTAGAVSDYFGVTTNGQTRNTDFISDLETAAKAGTDYNKRANLSSIYNTKVSNLNELTTATQQNDNLRQNKAADDVFDKNLVAHGVDLAGLQLQELREIKTWLITGLTAWALGVLTDKFIDKGISKLGGKLFNTGGGSGGTSGSDVGILSKLLTGGQGLNNAMMGGEIAANAGKLGGGLKAGGLIGGLTQGGTALTGGAASGGLAAGIGAGTLAAGGYMVGKGIGIGIDTAKNWDKSSTTDKTVGVASSAGAIVGGGLAGAAALGLASGPVGWVGLAIGAVALGGKAIYDHATRLSGLAEQYEEYGEQLKESFKQEQDNKIQETAFLKERIETATSTEAAQNEIISSGLLSEKTARDLTADELTNLVSEIIKTESAISSLGEASIDAKTKVAKEEAQDQTKDVLDDTYTNIKDLLGADKKVKKGEEEYAMIKSMFEGMASSITNDKERGLMEEQLKTIFAEGEFDLEELKILMNKGGGGRALWHTTMDTKRNFYDYAMDVDKANAYLGIIEGNGEYDLSDVNINQSTAAWQTALDEYYNKFIKATDDATKEANKNLFLNTWDTNIKSNNEYYEYLKPKYEKKAKAMGITEFKLGSTYIPEDMIAQLHAGERVLTAEQNKSYTQELMSTNSELLNLQNLNDFINRINEQNNIADLYDIESSLDDLKQTNTILLNSYTSPFEPLITGNPYQKINAMGQDISKSDLSNSSSSIIQAGVQDIVIAIKSQTSEIINYLSTISFTNSSFGSSRVSMLPTMGNTKVTL